MANEKRLIDANALLAEAEKAKIRFPIDKAIMFDLIKNATTVDAVLVVRCKDFKHYKPMKPYPSYNGSVNYCCRSSFIKVGNNDFCSYGERKDNG